MQNAKLKMKICNLQSADEQRGFTLVELLIAMAIASVLGMAGVSLFSTSNWAYKVNEDVAEAQQNARVSMERLTKDIRAAGFGLPDPPLPTFWFDVNGNTAQDAGETFTSPITVTTSSSTAPDSITIVGIGHEAGKLQDTADFCPDGTVPNKYTATCIHLNDTSYFFSGIFDTKRKYINIGGGKYMELATAGHVSTQQLLVLESPSTLDREYAANTPVFIIQAVTYYIQNDCTVLNPCWNLKGNDLTGLRDSGNQALAENIEDIQFAYGVDADGNGKMDSTTLSNDPITDDFTIVAVRATVVARTRNKDMKGSTFIRPVIEDHSASAPDNYRRRILTKILKVRNPRTGG